MRRDYAVAFLLALAAIPAGVALMAVPAYFGLSDATAPYWFYGGLGLTLVLFIVALLVALDFDLRRAQRMWPQLMTFAGAFLFTFGILFWVIRESGQSFWQDDAAKYVLELLGSHSDGIDASAVSFGVRIRNTTKDRFIVYWVSNNWNVPGQNASTTSMPTPLELAPERTATVLGPAFNLSSANHVMEIGMSAQIQYGFAGKKLSWKLDADYLLFVNPSDLSRTSSRLISSERRPLR